MFTPKDIDEVHVSVTFTWDMKRAEWLRRQWEGFAAKVLIGGPAYGDPGNGFVPGRYLKTGITITSRGCPNQCWFCYAWKREGPIRELPIRPGHIVQDNNLLACSTDHQRAVFDMLVDQKKKGRRAQLTGGLEAARFTEWHVLQLWRVRPERVFFAYDIPEDLEPLKRAVGLLHAMDFPGIARSHHFGAYVLCGYPGDTLEAAESRCRAVLEMGLIPCATIYDRDMKPIDDRKAWTRFQRSWTRVNLIRPERRGSP